MEEKVKSELTALLKADMKPALGVTEPGAIAYAVATAAGYLPRRAERVSIRLNSGIFKNAFTCGIPGSSQVGNFYAAALGAVAANPDKGLECLEGIGEKEHRQAETMVTEGKISVEMSSVSSSIFIEAAVSSEEHTATVTIRGTHTNIVKITADDKVIFERPFVEENETAADRIHDFSLEELAEYALTADIGEMDFIKEAYRINMELFEEGISSEKTIYAKYLLRKNGGIFSGDVQKTASLLCNAAIEARVLGLNKPAMSITGSGAHGIIATLPLYAEYKVKGLGEEALLRAGALSCLVCMYIKEYSGRLSAFCGCAIAAGTGMACGLVLLRGGGVKEMGYAIANMASSITGMICDGGNHGCTVKGIVAVDAAFESAGMAMDGVYIDSRHGINGSTPEETMRYMGMIASPGMSQTEAVIIDILEEKKHKKPTGSESGNG